MGTIVTDPASCREILERAGADATLASYDYETNTLTAPDVSDADLANTKAAVDGRTAIATANDKRAKAAEKQREAIERHHAAILAADATYQAELSAIAAATTLADLDAI